MEADTIYWFADFQDKPWTPPQIEEVVRKKLKLPQTEALHPRLHPAGGKSFEKVRDLLVTPLGGEVIETKAE
jgi:hypothetical protein